MKLSPCFFSFTLTNQFQNFFSLAPFLKAMNLLIFVAQTVLLPAIQCAKQIQNFARMVFVFRQKMDPTDANAQMDIDSMRIS